MVSKIDIHISDGTTALQNGVGVEMASPEKS